MIIRNLLSLSVLALTGYLVLVLAGHLWDRHSQETQAMGFSGIYNRYLGSSAGFAGDPDKVEGGQQVLGRDHTRGIDSRLHLPRTRIAS